MQLALNISIILSLSALLYSNHSKRRHLILLFKPLTIILIFILSITLASWDDISSYMIFIIMGLFCSIFGDILLMYKEKFLVGMICFLLTHLCYIWAIYSYGGFHTSYRLIPILCIWIYFIITVKPILSHKLKPPVIVYSFLLACLIWQSCELVFITFNPSILLFFAGIIMFATSDWILIVNKYHNNKLEVLKLPLYFIGQWFIALSITYY